MNETYKIAGEFRVGYAACLLVQGRDARKSVHWLAGWDAGYRARNQLGNEINAYLESLDLETLKQVRIMEDGK